MDFGPVGWNQNLKLTVALYVPEGFELPHLSCPATRQVVVPDINGTIGLALKPEPGAELVFVVKQGIASS